MKKPQVTAIGRMLKTKGDEPRLRHVIVIKSDGTVRTVIKHPA